jgi:hypothetical protein
VGTGATRKERLMFRPQFPDVAPPPGFVWQPCVYSFDYTNTPAFILALASSQESGWIPMHLDSDAPFILKAIKIVHSGLNVILRDPHYNELSDDFENPNEYSTAVSPWTVLEGPGIDCPSGSTFHVRLQGQ